MMAPMRVPVRSAQIVPRGSQQTPRHEAHDRPFPARLQCDASETGAEFGRMSPPVYLSKLLWGRWSIPLQQRPIRSYRQRARITFGHRRPTNRTVKSPHSNETQVQTTGPSRERPKSVVPIALQSLDYDDNPHDACRVEYRIPHPCGVSKKQVCDRG